MLMVFQSGRRSVQVTSMSRMMRRLGRTPQIHSFVRRSDAEPVRSGASQLPRHFRQAGKRLGVVIEVDIGMNRAGVAPGASVVALAREMSHLPVVADPSHGTGRRSLIPPMSRAAAALGADGLIVEVHPCPERALSDGPQSLDFSAFEGLMRSLAEPLRPEMVKEVKMATV